jgi:membrane-bound lytic murein transglycosylase D
MCFVSSKFPESPSYMDNSTPDPASSTTAAWLAAAACTTQTPPSMGLFSEPLRPERWLGLTSGPTVDEWISFYAEGPGRSYMAKAIARSVPYVAPMERIIKEEGLPPDLLALVYIESGFDMRATSRMRAVGPWQFMSRTAKRFGLTVNKYVDERRDPDLSTRAAARYLKYLHGLFDSWTLAAASYNSGEGRVLRALKSRNTRDFWSLPLPRQTREFVPKLAAVLAILSDPGRYGFSVPEARPFEFDVVEVNGPVRLSAVASVCGASESELEELNPALLRGITPPGAAGYRLKVPLGSGELCAEELSKIRAHVVSPGETLSQIASKYGVSTRAVARANALENPNFIRQGAILTIPPVVIATAGEKTGAALSSAADGLAKVIHYTVKPGDSLWRISAQFRTTVAELAKWNGLANVNRLKPGQVIKILVSREDSG